MGERKDSTEASASGSSATARYRELTEQKPSMPRSTSSTGCSYIGQAALRPEAKALVDFSLTETCAGKAIALAGIATFNADGTRVILALTTADGGSAMLLALVR